MTNVKEMISLFRERIKKFQEDNDFSTSFESKGKKKVETYEIKSLELKKSLREIFFDQSKDQSSESAASYEVKECDPGGNCFSYQGKRKIDDDSPDKFSLWKKESKNNLSTEEIDRLREEVQKNRENLGKLGGDELTNDNLHYSETFRVKKGGGKSEKTTHFNLNPWGKSDTSQTQTINQEAKQQTPNFLGKPRQ